MSVFLRANSDLETNVAQREGDLWDNSNSDETQSSSRKRRRSQAEEYSNDDMQVSLNIDMK